jgi:hypothetical protein
VIYEDILPPPDGWPFYKKPVIDRDMTYSGQCRFCTNKVNRGRKGLVCLECLDKKRAEYEKEAA